ncbi:MAG: hypothetical protein QOD06_647 [Candidatus Binatota bacterium]|jgi:uncharacterized membrane protein YeaQ/YmgE (transglycosylase-associated protein family)|nr:hypothetical protein [Candidatus Binatota bacterium]
MTLVEFLLLLLVAGVCGSVAQTIAGINRGGCLVSAGIGFVGAVVGVWLGRRLALPELFIVHIGEVRFPIVWSILGATVFLVLIRLLTARTRWY